MIALGPVLFEHWWLKHYPKIALGLAAITLGYYLLGLPQDARSAVKHAGVEYVSFIALLGYLKGIPFWWVAEHCWPMWMFGVAFLLAAFFFVDRRNYMRAPARVRAELAEPQDQWRFQGLANLGFLALILIAVFVENPLF